MKGESAEPCEIARRTPINTRVIKIGANQNFLFCLMNCQSWLIVFAFDIFIITSFSTFAHNAACPADVRYMVPSKTERTVRDDAVGPSQSAF